MGVTALIIMFAPAIGPTLSGILLGIFSWRAIFFSFVVVLAVGVAFASKFLVNPYELTRPSVDALSCVLSCIGFGGLVPVSYTHLCGRCRLHCFGLCLLGAWHAQGRHGENGHRVLCRSFAFGCGEHHHSRRKPHAAVLVWNFRRSGRLPH